MDTRNPVDRLLDAIRSAGMLTTDAYAADATLDATVPNWRFRRRGADAIRSEYARWFGHPATFVELTRIPLPDGEFVEYTLEWVQDGVRHQGHHAHRLVVAGGEIVSDRVWCGGRWPEPLLAEMEAADRQEAGSR